jgi:hypothetical protein
MALEWIVTFILALERSKAFFQTKSVRLIFPFPLLSRIRIRGAQKAKE